MNAKKIDHQAILKKLKALGSKRNREGMARFGIFGANMYGVSMPNIRKLGKQIGKDHQLAQKLWDSGIHEAKILASIVDDIGKVSESQMNKWIKDFDSWDVVDQTCMNLFGKHPAAVKLAKSWTSRTKEFERRAGFALMAVLAWQKNGLSDKTISEFFPLIKKHVTDERNFVKKSVNWALRQIGKRNENLRLKALIVARDIAKINSKAAKWIATDAVRELEARAGAATVADHGGV